MKQQIMLSIVFLLLWSCTQKITETQNPEMNIKHEHLEEAINKIKEKHPDAGQTLVERGVNHTGSLWRQPDGTPDEFVAFCVENYLSDPSAKEAAFLRISDYIETLSGNFNNIALGLRKNVDLQTGELQAVDHLFSAYSAGAHMINDFYANKIAFLTALNFPFYSTEEKNTLGSDWSDLEWGYARMGDLFSSRVPSELNQQAGSASAEADAYIAEYNIYMGKVLDEKGNSLFPSDMVLLSHWNLRDEIKANYANNDKGYNKQALIYQIMQRIIDQTIPEKVINSDKYTWDPVTNHVYNGTTQSKATPEPNTRYQQILNNFKALKAADAYHPVLNTAIKRSFSGNMQIPQEEVEAIFHEFLSAPQLKQTGMLIRNRLGRDLQPWDIWYDGFKARSSIPEEKLNAITRTRYPNAQAFEDDLINMLTKLGFEAEKANFLASRIAVDPARGSGHAWGASMKNEKARLRTRIPENGMDYKGFNIAVHEFGHNVEQTISLHEVPYYMMNGVPNTAFTEALAFTFQDRDLFLLGMNHNDPNASYLKTLDILWSVYEIMGVSMVDMQIWKWMYNNPDCTASELKEATLDISKKVWNEYFAPVFGIKDQTVLAVYSHMINSPMYLPNYAFGHLIHFQLEEHFKNNDFAPEVERIFSLGQLTPDEWMKKATGSSLSSQPLLDAATEALGKIG